MWVTFFKLTTIADTPIMTAMATLSKPVGYECKFVDQVSEDYLCELCKHVAREPNITSCCGETFCKACVDAVIQDNKPCPSCQETDFSYTSQKKYQRKILALKVCCLMKDRGCEWTRQLQHLNAHLDITTGDCVYVDVDCPSDCNQKVQKRNVNTHLDEECPNRDYICPHCSFRATFCEVSQHFEVCQYHPLVCPNRCGATFERDELEDHMKMCGLQKVQCEFSYAGCQAEFIRNKQKEHMEQNTQKHLALMAAATLRISQEQQQIFDQKLREQQQTFDKKLQEKDARIKSLKEQQEVFGKKLDEQQEEFHKQLEEKDQQIKTLEEQHGSSINTLRMAIGIPPYDITFSNYQEKKARRGYIDSPPMYTQPGGYMFRLTLCPNGLRDGHGTHVSVRVYSFKGDHDDNFEFPAKFTITVELVNQHRDQDHYTRDIQCEVTKEKIDRFTNVGENNTFIPHADLEWNARKQTQYLKNDCLKLKITKVVMQ